MTNARPFLGVYCLRIITSKVNSYHSFFVIYLYLLFLCLDRDRERDRCLSDDIDRLRRCPRGPFLCLCEERPLFRELDVLLRRDLDLLRLRDLLRLFDKDLERLLRLDLDELRRWDRDLDRLLLLRLLVTRDLLIDLQQVTMVI